MATSRFSFGVMAILATLIFALVIPAVHAQSPAPAPAPTSDGNLSLNTLFRSNIQSCFRFLLHVDLTLYLTPLLFFSFGSVFCLHNWHPYNGSCKCGCICVAFQFLLSRMLRCIIISYKIGINLVCIIISTLRDVHRSRDRICADVVGSGTHIPHPLRRPLLQLLNFEMDTHAWQRVVGLGYMVRTLWTKRSFPTGFSSYVSFWSNSSVLAVHGLLSYSNLWHLLDIVLNVSPPPSIILCFWQHEFMVEWTNKIFKNSTSFHCIIGKEWYITN